jgi:RNA recognition motif-containing protein
MIVNNTNQCINVKIVIIQQYKALLSKSMVKQITAPQSQQKRVKNSKYNRFDDFDKVDEKKKNTWPADGVVYLGHLPHGFYEEQLKGYFSQYGEVLGVKVARSKKTARSKGYGFVQFRYP